MLKSVCVISALALLGACSHHQPKKDTKSYHVGKSFMDVIKTKRPGKPKADERFPASAKSVPGLKEFIAALKENPGFLKSPVGYEVIKEYSGAYQGESYTDQDTSVYLKEKLDGHFVLETYEDNSTGFFMYETQRIDGLLETIARGDIKSFEKLSPTKFRMTITFSETKEIEGTCQLVLDLTKSSELQDSSCKTEAGDLTSVTKVISVKPINVQDYAATLKAIKLEVYPNALNCGMVTVETEEESSCNDSVKDEKERDWSYLLK